MLYEVITSAVVKIADYQSSVIKLVQEGKVEKIDLPASNVLQFFSYNFV